MIRVKKKIGRRTEKPIVRASPRKIRYVYVEKKALWRKGNAIFQNFQRAVVFKGEMPHLSPKPPAPWNWCNHVKLIRSRDVTRSRDLISIPFAKFTRHPLNWEFVIPRFVRRSNVPKYYPRLIPILMYLNTVLSQIDTSWYLFIMRWIGITKLSYDFLVSPIHDTIHILGCQCTSAYIRNICETVIDTDLPKLVCFAHAQLIPNHLS